MSWVDELSFLIALSSTTFFLQIKTPCTTSLVPEMNGYPIKKNQSDIDIPICPFFHKEI